MSNLSKDFTIFLAIISTVVGISKDYNKGLLNLTHKTESCEHAVLFSSENANSIFYLHRQNENVINFENNSLFPSLRNISTDYFANSYFFELRLNNINNQYYSFSKIINKSLSIQVIIFPFHSFG